MDLRILPAVLLLEPGGRITKFWPLEGARRAVLLASGQTFRHSGITKQKLSTGPKIGAGRVRKTCKNMKKKRFNWDNLLELKIGEKNGYLKAPTIIYILCCPSCHHSSQIQRREHKTCVCFVKNSQEWILWFHNRMWFYPIFSGVI